MKNCICVLGLAALVAPFAAYSDSLIRVKCDDDAGASVYINGKFVGECPVDAPAPAGTVNLRVRSENGDYEKIFEKQLRVIDGVPQRVEVTLPAPQLTAKAIAAQSGKLLKAAESGDIDAMQKVSQFYEDGIGLEKNPVKAKHWREKAETAKAKEILELANGGNVAAMEDMSNRYKTGLGVAKSASLAKSWGTKAQSARQEQKSREKKAKLWAKAPFSETRQYFHNMGKDIQFVTSSPISLPFTIVFDLISLPTASTNMVQVANEAALRPSTWGKPDSMIARASLQIKANDPAAENPLIVAAIK